MKRHRQTPSRSNRTLSSRKTSISLRENAIVNKAFPVIPVRNDPLVLQVPEGDFDLQAFRAQPGDVNALASVLAGLSSLVCRVDGRRSASQAMVHQGSGVLVAPDVVLTCRHVAATFAVRGSKGWKLRTGGAAAAVIFDSSPTQGESISIPVSSVLFAGSASSEKLAMDIDEPELALLRLAKAVNVPALTVEAFDWWTDLDPAPGSLRGVTVISYPADPFTRDGAGNKAFIDPELRTVNICDVEDQFEPGGSPLYGTKCVTVGQFGASHSSEDRHRLFAAHDCSTLGGSSGGAVVDTTIRRIIGIHCGGTFGEQNQFQLFCVALGRIGLAQTLKDALVAADATGL